jgi:protein-disulfide isomerase
MASKRRWRQEIERVAKTAVKPAPAPARWPQLALALGAGLVVIVIVALIWALRRGDSLGVEVLDLSGTVEMGLTAEGRPYRGSLQAPVVVRAYEDPLCPQCRDFFTTTEPSVLEEYIKTGKVREEAYFLPFLGADSVPAAEAAECAAEQGKFWEYRQILFLNPPVGDEPPGREQLLIFARVAGVDLPAFTNCFDGGRHRLRLGRLLDEAIGDGIDATPIFVINGRVVPGARPFVGDEKGPGFKEFLDAALAGEGVE